MTASGARSGGGSRTTGGPGVAARVIEACAYCAKPARLRRTLTLALVVGVILTLFNQGDVILDGTATDATAVKAGLNFVVPFLVSNLGMLSGRGTAGAEGL